MFQKLPARIFLAAVLLLVGTGSHAAFHSMQITEVYSNADGTVQFIELQMTMDGQTQLSGRMITSTQGSTSNSFRFGSNVSNGASGSRILIGTSGYAALPGVPSPDYVIANNFVFTSDVSINFAGAALAMFGAVPTDGTLSIAPDGATATNSPTNNAGQSGTVVLSNPTPPGAPNIGTATAGNAQATISFTAGSAGSSPTTGFTATCTSTGQTTRTGTANASPITVAMLANGNVYSCSVTATNANGTSPASSSINVMPTAPASAPGAPLINSISPGNTQATINFSPPASDGGAMISNYIATCGTAVSSGPSSPVTVTGLTNGASVACTVAAVNSAGTGTQSSPVNVTPGTTPGTPTITSAVAGNAQANIFFTTPADGGSAIINYSVSCNPGQFIATGAASPISVTGLANGTAYTCTVTATNGFGSGNASAPVSVTPANVPGAPTIGTPVAGDGRAAVFFTMPVSNGGSAILSYTATCGAFSATGAASPITVTGLTNNSTFVCFVVATNAIGNSTASATANVTPSSAAQLTPIAVLARKIHGGAGTFDLPVDTVPPITGAVSVEPRNIGSGHTLVFQFNVPVTSTGTVTTTPVGTVSAVASGYDVVVTLTNVSDNQRATISLTDVNGAGVNVAASLGFLVGDVNNTRSVNSSDISSVKARSGQATSALNFRFDVNATGAISAADISTVKARSGLVLPP